MKYKPNTHRNTIHSTKLMHTLQGPEGDKNSSHSHRVSEWWTDVRKKKTGKYQLVDDTGTSGEHEGTITKLSSLGKGMKFKSPEKTYLFCLPTKESEMIDFSCSIPLRWGLKQHTSQLMLACGPGWRLCQVSLGVKCSKEAATASKGPSS